ncbi:MAG: hypothetical protein IJR89_02895 [Clostridia bacterium]|nr:hypothetical protein [Clostridia bacterium]
MRKTAKPIAFFLAAVMLLALCACGSKKKPEGDPDQAGLISLYDYAKSLEAAGNSEAAAAVYELIAEGGGAELIEKAHDGIPAIRSVDEIRAIEEIFDHAKGGEGK